MYRLLRFIESTIPNAEINGYWVNGDRVVFDRVEEPGKLLIGLPPRIPQHSPKYRLLPPEHVLLYVNRDYGVELPKLAETPMVFFGVKPCDVAAIRVLDSILVARHPVYTQKRSLLKLIVVEECLDPLDTCFCGDVGSGPATKDYYDVSYAALGDTVFFKAGTGVGVNLLRNIGLRKPSGPELDKYESALKRAAEKASNKVPGLIEIRKALASSVVNVDLWRDLSKYCLACGSCNYVCPTCFCTEIEDVIEGGSVSARVAKWVGCRTYTYGLVAGGHFRQELYTRYRHFALHKMVFYSEQVGVIGCVGCGRCSAWCPAGLDFKETLREVVKWYQ